MGSLLNSGRGLIAPVIAFCLAAAWLPWMPDANTIRWGLVALLGVASAVYLLRHELDRTDIVTLLLIAWCGFTVLWAPDHRAGIDAFAKMASVALVFLALRRVTVSKWTVPAGVVGILLVGLGNAGFDAEFLLIAAPLMWLPVALVLLGAAALLPSLIPWVGIAVMAVATTRTRLLAAGMVGVVIVTGVAALSFSGEARVGLLTRLDLWAGTFGAALGHPLLGTGLGSFAYIFPDYADVGAALGVPPYSVESATFANAAHSDPLQLLMETGPIGLGLAIYLASLLLRRATGGARVALYVAIGLSLIGFPFQNPATALLIALAAARSGVGETLAIKWVALPFAFPAVLLLVGFPNAVFAQAHLSAALRHLQPGVISDNPRSAVAALQHANEAYRLDPANFRARLELFQTAAMTRDRFPEIITRDAVEAAWQIAQTASPRDSGLLLTRLGFLSRQKDCGDCPLIVATLERTASRKQEVLQLMRRFKERA